MVIDSGDDLPNHAPRASMVAADVEEEKRFQRIWVREHIEDYKRWLDGRTYVVSGGNHTFVNTAEILQANGIQAINIDGFLSTYCGIAFYGFPYVPRIQGHWNGELDHEQMREAVAKIPKSKVDILVAHCPPFGILSDEEDPNRPSSKLGNQHLSSWLDYDNEYLPKFLMCGHFHRSHGSSLYRRNDDVMIISNAATTVHCFEYGT
jgi:Icc-related predicted phosphoesterase